MTGFDLLPNDVLPPLPQLATFAVAALALNVTPGADMTLVGISAARSGVRAGFAAALGVAAGCCVHILFAVAGLSALIAASQTAFTVLKWAGAAYLLYLAWGLIRSAPAKADPSEAPDTAHIPQAPADARRAFRQGALVNVTNPKVGLFFLAFLPQFIDPAHGHQTIQIAALGLWFTTSGTLVNFAVALVAARLKGSARLGQAIRWATASIMGGLAVRLALSER
ncbi:LysE family translocator [Pedomonas sp. V897]|uniref:LysE family translocator n=1 Tax=Pedomonas sp. V897 TaxID=3446482 RepID=UPI003EE16CFD